MGYLVINGVYLGYNPLTNLLLTSWGILVGIFFSVDGVDLFYPNGSGGCSGFDLHSV